MERVQAVKTKDGRPFSLAVVGVPVVDMVAYVEQFPAAGGTSPGDALSVMPGGPAINVATGAARLGHAALLLGKIGQDPLGQLLFDGLTRDGVVVPETFRVPDAATAAVLVIYDQQGKGEFRSFAFRQNTADTRLSPADMDPGLFEGVPALFLDGILALDEPLTQAGERAAELGARQGMRIFCDPNVRVPGDEVDASLAQRLHRLVRTAHEVLLSEKEARMLLRAWGEERAAQGDAQTLARALDRVHPAVQCWVVKCGAEGAVVFDGHDLFAQPAFPVNVSDTSGAGDSFAAAWIVAYVEGKDRRAAARWASAAAALTVSGKGAWSSLPTREQLERFLSRWES